MSAETLGPRAVDTTGGRLSSTRLILAYWLPAAMVAVVIALLSSVPGSHLPLPTAYGLDKAAHFVVFGVLGLLLARASAATWRWGWPTRVAVTSLAVAAFGVLDEIHQSFVPYRSVEVLDVVADTLGGLTAALVWWWYARSKGKR